MRTTVRPQTFLAKNLILGLFCFIWASLVYPGVLTVGATYYIGGLIFHDMTWTKANSPYTVIDYITVLNGVTLTIEPGVAVIFNDNFAIDIDGALIARGTSDQNITFTPAKGVAAWGYIHFNVDSLSAAYDVNGNYISGSIMEYCLLDYGGGANVSYNGALRLENAQPLINHCTVQHSLSAGIFAWSLSGTLKITNCTISNNQLQGINLTQNSYPGVNPYGPSQIANNTIAANGSSGDAGGGICISGPGVEISNNIIRNNQGGIGGGIYINGASSLSRNIIRDNKASGYGGGVYGVYATNVSDNVITGNTAVNDGGGYSGASGQFTNNILSGNTSDSDGGGLYGSANTMSNNSLIRNRASTYSAAYLSGYTNFIKNLITGNNATGQPSSTTGVSGSPVLNDNNIFRNTANYALTNENNESSTDIDGTNNWWGSTKLGDIIDMIFDRHWDPTRGIVVYIPYALALRTDAPISPPQGVKVDPGLKITWNANQEADLAGYKVYWGTTPGYPYAHYKDVGKVTSCMITGLPPDTYYVAVTAYDSDYIPANDIPSTLVNENQTGGHESWFSTEVSKTPVKITPCLLLLLN
jgi:parallel beta-helix repeat protein